MPVPHGAAEGPVLSWLHIGDLHTKEAGAPNHLDLQRIAAPEKHIHGTQLSPNRNGRKW